jgi:transcriptional regulator with XRE-family HTH domain
MAEQLLTGRSTQEWEEQLGHEVRRLRLRLGRSQERLARDAGLSLSAVKSLEAGDGSRLRTLVLVARALGRDDWLDSFLPPEPAVSPMRLLREQQQHQRANPARQRAPRQPRGPVAT